MVIKRFQLRYGIVGKVLGRLQSYLEGRTKQVVIHDALYYLHFPGDVSAQCVINIKTVLCTAKLKAYMITIPQTTR